jgi:dipeptide/tripeptide permease
MLDIQPADGNVELTSINLETGGSYIVSLSRNLTFQKIKIEKDSLIVNIYTLTEPNAVSMLWLLPQYIVMSIAEVLLEVSLTGFAYDQAPKNLKSLLQVVNLIPPALGGMLVIIFAKLKFFKQQVCINLSLQQAELI